MSRAIGMDIAVSYHPAQPCEAQAGVSDAAGVIDVEVFQDMAAAEPLWRDLERSGAIATPYQRYDWVKAWQRHVGARSGVVPFLVVGRDCTGEPAFLWPLGQTRCGPLGILRFLGGKHSNFNFALWQRDAANALTAADLRIILQQIASMHPGIDMVQLLNQPMRWDGLANPLLRLAHQPSPSLAFRGRLGPDFEALLAERMSPVSRRKLRRKGRRLAKHGPVQCWRAKTVHDALRVLDVFFDQKSTRMRELGLKNAFEAPGVREFITEAATKHLPDGTPAIELYALAAGETIVATMAGAVSNSRFSCMFNSIIRNELAHESPGEHLLVNLVQMHCERGLLALDLGVGEAVYKEQFCDEIEPLFDSFVPMTARGYAAAHAFRTAYAVKRLVKAQPILRKAVGYLRRLRAG